MFPGTFAGGGPGPNICPPAPGVGLPGANAGLPTLQGAGGMASGLSVTGAIGTVAKTVDPHNGGALQHFGDGILAFLPLPEKPVRKMRWGRFIDCSDEVQCSRLCPRGPMPAR